MPKRKQRTRPDSKPRLPKPVSTQSTKHVSFRPNWRLVLGLVLVLGLGSFILLANRPSTGTILPAPPPPPVTTAPATQQIDGTHLTFTAPASYTVKEHEVDQPTARERFVLRSEGDQGTRKLTMSLEPLRVPALQDVPSVSFRRATPKLYTEQTLEATKDGISKLRFTRTDENGREITLFWVSQQQLLTMSVTTSAVGAEVEADFASVVNSLKILD